MSKPKSLTDKIFDIIMVSPTALTAAEIKRALPDAVDSGEVSCRLCYLVSRKFVVVAITTRQAITGRKAIKCYSASPNYAPNENNYQQLNILSNLLQTQ